MRAPPAGTPIATESLHCGNKTQRADIVGPRSTSCTPDEGAAALVWFAPDLVWLNIAVQVLNVFLLPVAIGLLVALAVTALPKALQPRGSYLGALIATSGIGIAVGIFGGISRWLQRGDS